VETPLREVRKTVTILFCDVVHSTGLAEGIDPEALRRVMWRFFDEMRAVLERHGGTVEKFAGDDVMAVFGVPVVHEDDALRAVRAAAEMHERLERLNEELERTWAVRIAVRIGINTGEVVAGDAASGHAFVTGEPVVLAKRLEAAAAPGEILIGKATYPLIKDAVKVGPLERFPAKGKREEAERRRVDAVDREAPGVVRRLDVPMIGREGELALLRQAFQRVVDEQRCRLFTILGAAGIGKSRLAAELSASVGDRATTVHGRCLPYGEGITYWPLAEIIRELGGLTGLEEALASHDDADTVVRLLAGAIGATEITATSEETFWAVRRVFEALAQERPLVVCLDDVHWAEPTFLDVIEYVLGWSRGAPILLLCLARPDLVEERPTWIAPQAYADAVALQPLSAREAGALLEGLRGEAELNPQALERITEAAEGNPLFVVQMAAMTTEGNGDGELSIPPSIQALLAERLDRLSAEERAVIECASVIGRDFSAGAVAELSPPDVREELTRHLLALVRKELVRPDTSRTSDDDGFRFHHVLVRDAAYHGIPKELRAELHARLAEWVDGRGLGREPEELVGYHLEQAHQARVQLGLFDDRTRELGEHASTLLASSGRRALDLGDMRAAAALFGRASALLPPDHPERRALAPDHATALIAGGDLTGAERLLTGAVEAAGAARERGVEAHALVVLANLRFATRPADAVSEAERVSEQTIQTFSRLGDEIGLAHAWRLLAYADATRGRWSTTADRLEKALAHAEHAGDRRTQETILSFLPLAFLYGPMPVEEAIGRCEEIRRGATGDPLLEAGVAALLAPLLAMRGRNSEARELSERSTTLLEDLGAVALLANALAHRAQAEVLAGRHLEAERDLRRSHETFDMIGDKVNAAAAGALLAEALEAQGRHAEADRWTELVDQTALADDVLGRVAWGAARAKALARATRLDEAERLAREVVAVARETDALNMRAQASLALAQVLRQAGIDADATPAAGDALALYEQKGNLVGAAQAEQLLAELRTVTTSASPGDP
jgi:class 3 adenylate cyclase/tetratricopeptide (TPR) repeat protein